MTHPSRQTLFPVLALAFGLTASAAAAVPLPVAFTGFDQNPEVPSFITADPADVLGPRASSSQVIQIGAQRGLSLPLAVPAVAGPDAAGQ